MRKQNLSSDGQKKQNFLSCLLSYAREGKRKLVLSVILSVISITAGLVPYYCFYHILVLFLGGETSVSGIWKWSLLALAVYVGKVLCFGLSTMASHYAAYHILEGLRNRVADRFLHAPLGEVAKHSIGEIKGIMVDKIEDIEPPLAHLVPEGSGHIVLPLVSMAVLAVMLSMSMAGSLAKLEVFWGGIKKVQMTVEELQEYLEMPELQEKGQDVKLKGYDVELKSVRFSYDEDEVLHGVSLKLPQGSFTALVGPSGGGKSTVARLVSRFYDVSSGSISIGGVDIREMPLAQLSGIVSFVAQDNFLFRCSIKENIRMGNPDASDEQVARVAKAAECGEFIKKLPNGYDTPAGEAGKRLSGGEKQRIAIARMMLKDSPVVILDEATAFTDPENEDKIQKSIRELAKGKTLLVIAHRLSTIKNADNIVVLENGRLLAQGRQEELLENCPLYQKMWESHIGAKSWPVGKEVTKNV